MEVRQAKEYPNNYVAVKMSSLGINYKYSLAEDYCIELINIAKKNNTKILIDAEYDSIQYFINLYSTQALKYHNKDEVWVYKTYQMYRNDSFESLKNDFLRRNIKNDYYLGIKLVRGAYLNQDRKHNIIEVNTFIEPAPITGSPLFNMEVKIEYNSSFKQDQIKKDLIKICNQLNLTLN